MENCLVKKLKGTVSADILQFGHVRLQLNDVEQGTVSVSLVDGEVRIIGDGVWSDTNTKTHVTPLETGLNPAGSYLLDISDKYNLTALTVKKGSSSENAARVYIDLSEFKFSDNLTSFKMASNAITGNIKDLIGNKTNMRDISMAYSKGVYGNLEDIKDCYTTTITGIRDFNIYTTNVEGSLKYFLDNIAAKRTSEFTLNVNAAYSLITTEGVNLDSTQIVHSVVFDGNGSYTVDGLPQ